MINGKNDVFKEVMTNLKLELNPYKILEKKKPRH